MRENVRIYLSPPHMSGIEMTHVNKAFETNWIAPTGPDIVEFEKEVCRYTGAAHAVALSSGTAAIHLALKAGGVGAGDDVYCSNFTFAGTVFPVEYCGANLILVDCEMKSWNMDPEMLREAIDNSRKTGHTPKAVVLVHLYGQSADTAEILKICNDNGVLLIEDAAESLGAYNGNLATGTMGDFGIYSFNGNKIITTSGGGMLVGRNKDMVETVRYLSTQARDPFPYYEHSNIGYNYRMSNILAAIGRGQMMVLEKRIQRRREIFRLYSDLFSKEKGITMMPNDCYGRSNCWLSCILIDDEKTGKKPEDIRLELEEMNIESRPLWKPMHLQPVFKSYPVFSQGVSDELFKKGLCLPSGTAMDNETISRVATLVLDSVNRG